jgi:hypothetical protein
MGIGLVGIDEEEPAMRGTVGSVVGFFSWSISTSSS